MDGVTFGLRGGRSGSFRLRGVMFCQGVSHDGRDIVLVQRAITRPGMVTLLLAEEANGWAVTPKWDLMWASTRIVMVFHLVIAAAMRALNLTLREFALTSKV